MTTPNDQPVFWPTRCCFGKCWETQPSIFHQFIVVVVVCCPDFSSASDIYYLWTLAGGDVELDLTRRGLIKTRLPVFRLPRWCSALARKVPPRSTRKPSGPCLPPPPFVTTPPPSRLSSPLVLLSRLVRHGRAELATTVDRACMLDDTVHPLETEQLSQRLAAAKLDLFPPILSLEGFPTRSVAAPTIFLLIISGRCSTNRLSLLANRLSDAAQGGVLDLPLKIRERDLDYTVCMERGRQYTLKSIGTLMAAFFRSSSACSISAGCCADVRTRDRTSCTKRGGIFRRLSVALSGRRFWRCQPTLRRSTRPLTKNRPAPPITSWLWTFLAATSTTTCWLPPPVCCQLRSFLVFVVLVVSSISFSTKRYYFFRCCFCLATGCRTRAPQARAQSLDCVPSGPCVLAGPGLSDCPVPAAELQQRRFAMGVGWESDAAQLLFSLLGLLESSRGIRLLAQLHRALPPQHLSERKLAGTLQLQGLGRHGELANPSPFACHLDIQPGHSGTARRIFAHAGIPRPGACGAHQQHQLCPGPLCHSLVRRNCKVGHIFGPTGFASS